jgi:3',5'-cyclic AMP phosphodiesterase CpdA
MTYDEMIRLYANYKTFDNCAVYLGVNRKTFAARWYDKGLPNPVIIKKSKYNNELDKYKVAICGDLHLGSKQQQVSLFLDFIDEVKKQNIETLVILGDLVEGLMKRDGSVHSRFLHSIDEIYKYTYDIFSMFADDFNRVLLIEGNHDATLNGRCDGFDLCHHLAGDFLNIEYRKEPLDNVYPVTLDGGAKAILYHGSGGCGKNLTTRTRAKTIDFTNIVNEFDMILCAHCHRTSFDIWLQKYGISVGSFQGITKYFADMGLAPNVQGDILSYNIGKRGKVLNLVRTPYNYDDRLKIKDW